MSTARESSARRLHAISISRSSTRTPPCTNVARSTRNAARQRAGQAVELEPAAERGLDAVGGEAQRIRAAREPQHATGAGQEQEREDREGESEAAESAGHQNLTPSEKCSRTELVSWP